ncbi:MAG: Cell division protein ftsA [Parcubacteria group bacterium GW2011_GWC2_38_7]|nr:MAG: Cell division protein ftsA [Parcubacteria group bacterium GW2011_GWC2_38_7]
MAENIIAGLDIGSSNIRVVIGQLAKNNDSEQLNVIGVIEVPAMGMNKGSVVSIEDTVSSISACLEKAERMIGLPIENVWVGIGGVHISSQESNGVIAIARTNGEIQENDVGRVIEAARAVAAPVNYEVLHVIPKSFSIDNQTGVKDPIGMSGIRLEVTTQVIRGLSSQIKNLTKSIYRTGLDINDLVLSVLAAGEAVLSVRQKELGVALVDIGAATTKLIVFEEGDVIHVAILPLGADHITRDLGLGLQTSLDVAERIKLDIGSALVKEFNKEDEINLRDYGGEDQTFSKKYIAEIIEARVEEIFQKVDQELQKINRSGLLPAGIVLIGGGSKLTGMIELGKKKTMLPVAIGNNKRFNTAVDKVNDVSFTTALGLVMWGYSVINEKGGKGPWNFNAGGKVLKDGLNKAKEWFKHLIS